MSKLTTDVLTYCTEASNQKSKYAYRKIFFYKKSTDELYALNVPVSSAVAERALNSYRLITNWCVLADSLSEKSVKQLCSAAWNGDLYVDLKAVTLRKFTASLHRH